MLSEPSFAEFGKQVILFCHITSHVESDPYQDLLMKKGGRGWPHLAFLDAKGEVAATPRITTLEPAPLLKTVRGTASALATLRENEKKAEAGDEKAMVAVFRSKLKLGSIALTDATARFQVLDKKKVIDAEARKAIQQQIVNLEVGEVVSKLGRSRQAMKAAADKFTAMRKAGKIPDDSTARTFWAVQINVSLAEKDSKTAVEVAKAWKARLDPESKPDAPLIQQLDRLIADHEKNG